MNSRFKFRFWDKKQKKFKYPKLWDNTMSSNWDEFYEMEQWTGLKDKNGFDIYFGDILRGPFATGMYGKSVRRKLFNFEVKHYVDKHSGVTYITSMPKDYGNYRFCPYITECEVVGNIHENTELLNQ